MMRCAHLGQLDKVGVAQLQAEVLQPHACLLPLDHAEALVVCSSNTKAEKSSSGAVELRVASQAACCVFVVAGCAAVG